MAHRKREAYIPELLDRLDRPAEVVWDRHNDRWDTGRRAWEAVDPKSSHGMVIQDDAVVCRDLVAGVEAALDHVPEAAALGLYVGRVRPYRDLIQQLIDRAGTGTSWLVMDQLHWGVGVVMPAPHIGDMLAWCETRRDIPNYDKRISWWCQRQGLTVYYPWPSLVDHRDSPSLVPGRGSAGRHAHQFLGTDRSALRHDWGGAVLDLDGWRIRHRAASRNTQHLPATEFGATPRPRQPERGATVRFVSTKYPELQVYTARVRFRGGVAEVTREAQIEELLTLRHMGVVPAAEDSAEPAPAEAASTASAEATEPAQAVAADEESPGTDTDTSGEPDQLADAGRVPTGGAKDVLEWVGDDPQLARRALDAEQAREKPRSTLVAALTKLAG